MNFAFSSDQQLLKNSARAFLDEHMTPAAVRLLWDDPRGESEATWKEMAQLGWLGLSLPEAYGGSESPSQPSWAISFHVASLSPRGSSQRRRTAAGVMCS